jgi:integral membrane protein (TIGR01906 family)
MGGDALRRSVRVAALGLTAGTLVLGVVSAVAFDAAFEVFHEFLFAGGTWTFDPQTDRLVQLFPWQLWFETSLAAGGLIVGLSLLVTRLSGPAKGRADHPSDRPSAAGDAASVAAGEAR